MFQIHPRRISYNRRGEIRARPRPVGTTDRRQIAFLFKLSLLHLLRPRRQADSAERKLSVFETQETLKQ